MKGNSKNTDTISVRQINLSPPAITFAFYYRGVRTHALITVVQGEVELMDKDGSYTASVQEIHYLNSDCMIKSNSCEPPCLWLLSFTEDFALSALYAVNRSNIKFLDSQHYPMSADKESFKTIISLLELLDRHHSSTRENSFTISILAFNLILSSLEELHHFSLIGRPERLRRTEITAIQFFRLVEDCVTEHHDVGFYAGKLCIEQGHMAKIIKSVTGRTPKSIIDDAVIRLTKQMLHASTSSIYSIAEESGFKSSSAFINFFKSHCGYTPQEYRNRKTK
ncbi:helix-turn-helix domain-containing protein [Flavobacterium sp. RHBU_24]|uniref:helix-turn-helix domain-containing protein n=1 Tax=Flavobacterium sp. RHBU_24 TaxID=3391185 RepID=UPI003984AAA6